MTCMMPDFSAAMLAIYLCAWCPLLAPHIHCRKRPQKQQQKQLLVAVVGVLC